MVPPSFSDNLHPDAYISGSKIYSTFVNIEGLTKIGHDLVSVVRRRDRNSVKPCRYALPVHSARQRDTRVTR